MVRWVSDCQRAEFRGRYPALLVYCHVSFNYFNSLKPVFVDTDLNFGNLDQAKVQNAITYKTGGILRCITMVFLKSNKTAKVKK